MADVDKSVSELAGEWLDLLMHRIDEQLSISGRTPCRACPVSGLIPALGAFGGLPHHLVHPLIRRIDYVVDDIVDEVAQAQAEALAELWHDAIRLDRDGTPPDPVTFAAAVEHVEYIREKDRDYLAAVSDATRREAREALARFTEARQRDARWLVRRLLEGVTDAVADLEPDQIGHDERALVVDAVSADLHSWFVWLAGSQWLVNDPVPGGAVCVVCRRFGVDAMIGVHGAAHPLAVRLAARIDDLVENVGRPRIEPPGSGLLARFERDLVTAVRAELDERAPHIRRAAELYVLPVVDREVRDSARHLPVAGDEDAGRSA